MVEGREEEEKADKEQSFYSSRSHKVNGALTKGGNDDNKNSRRESRQQRRRAQ